MQSILLVCTFLLFSNLTLAAMTPLISLPLNEMALREDLKLILKAADLKEDILDFSIRSSDTSKIVAECSQNKLFLKLTSPPGEETSSLYKALRELGFLFPHPLRQISPDKTALLKKCGKSWSWKPTLMFRGFHLHTLHPNEWVSGFYQDSPYVGEATIRWMARNQQNIMDLSLLRVPLPDIKKKMTPLFRLARSFQIHTGVSLGIAFHQQNSFKLLTLWESIFGNADQRIQKNLLEVLETLPLSYLVLEAGTSEFTPSNFEKTLHWLNLSAKILRSKGVALFTKVHVSSNQISKEWGNYNFLPQFADSSVGILPHTVMFYGLEDQSAPMYGNKNFQGIRNFMLKENKKRPTWYYPETSYWIGMDVDVPLFLTDYLYTRAQDMKFLFDNNIQGQLNFTSGHALGYWLFDWNLALLCDSDYDFNPLTGLELLGENIQEWKKIGHYQRKWYKEKGLISILSSANLQDELSESHRIHERFTMKQLSENTEALDKEIELLRESLKALPDHHFVISQELKTLLEINNFRKNHALSIRLALRFSDKKDAYLEEAVSYRRKALSMMPTLQALPTNYPELPLFKKWDNPTSYQFGYVYPAAELYFWKREETQIQKNSYFPFWENIYDVFDIIF